MENIFYFRQLFRGGCDIADATAMRPVLDDGDDMNAIRPMVGQGVVGGCVPPVQVGGAVPAVSPGYVPSAYVSPSGLLRGVASAPTMRLPGICSLVVAGAFVVFALVGCNQVNKREENWTESDPSVEKTVGYESDECLSRQDALDFSFIEAVREANRVCGNRIWMDLYGSKRKFESTGYDVSAEETKGGGCWIGRARVFFRCTK